MQRSKLEMCIDILKVLAQKGPQKLTHIMHKANINCNVLKTNLDFLLAQGLIEERNLGKRNVVYANTPKGIAVLKYFKELNTVLPVVEERDKRLSLPY